MEQRQNSPRWARPLRQALRGLLLTLAAGGFLATAGCESFQSLSRDKDILVLKPLDAEDAKLHLRWQAAIGLDRSNDEVINHVWRVTDSVYVGTSRNMLYALDASSGVIRWRADIAQPEEGLLSPCDLTGGKKVLVLTSGTAMVLDKARGNVLKKAPLPFSAACDPVVAGNTVLVGSGKNYFYGAYVDFLGTPRWSVFEREDSFISKPVVVNSASVIFASRKGIVYQTSIETAGTGWKRQVNGEVVAPLTLEGHTLYIPCMDYKVYAFDTFNANLVWNPPVRLDSPLSQPAVVLGPNLLVTSDTGLYSLATATGDRKWYTPGITNVLSTAPNAIYATDAKKHLLVLNPETGAIRSTTTLAPVETFARNTLDATVYVATPDGRIAAIEPVK